MKSTFLALGIAVLCAGCMTPQHYYQRVNNIPTRPYNFDVKIVMLGDPVPAKPFFEIVEFNLREKGKMSEREMKNKLQMEAIKEGVDAVIDVEISRNKELVSNVFSLMLDLLYEDEETILIPASFTYAYGVGIKFLESLDYIHELPEFEYVYIVDEKTRFPSPFFKIEYTLTGQEHMVYPESEKALDVYKQYFQFYSDFHLIHHRERWAYYKNKDHRISRRVLLDDHGEALKKCLFSYDASGWLSEITILDLTRVFSRSEHVKYHYDLSGQLQSKIIHTRGKSRIYEEYKYEGGRLKGRNIRIMIPGKENYLLSTTYTYHPKDYLEKYYKDQLANSGKD